jgi:antiviral helicase SLH1
MKALAAEIVRKISKRLQWLSISVRELTGMFNSHPAEILTCFPGDMQLTKAEIAQTQIIVTTPEKWDVVTRKPTGEGEIASVRNSPAWNAFTDNSKDNKIVDHR